MLLLPLQAVERSGREEGISRFHLDLDLVPWYIIKSKMGGVCFLLSLFSLSLSAYPVLCVFSQLSWH